MKILSQHEPNSKIEVTPKARVNSFSEVSYSILMEGVKVGRYAKVTNAIIENSVKIPQGMEIGYDLEKDINRFHVSPSGLVVVTRDDITKAERKKTHMSYDYYFREDISGQISNVKTQSSIFANII